VTKKNSNVVSKGFIYFEINESKSLDFKDFLGEISQFRQRFQQVAKIHLAGFLKYLLSSLICSQIWLIPLVHDCQCGYITKLQKRKPRSIELKCSK
jgi:hypothetical protein